MTEKPKQVKQVPRSLWGFTVFTLLEIVHQKKWVLMPIWILLAAIALIIVIGGGSAILPAIYIAF